MVTHNGKNRKKLEISDKLNLRALRIFIALEEFKSVGKAAESLGLSKSSVSQHITTLERSVGIPLFDRKQKPIALTHAGQVLSLHANRILANISAAEAALADINAGSLPILNFAIIDDLDASLTPVLATTLQERLTQSFIRTYSGRSDHVTKRLINREADIAVTATLPANLDKFEVQELYKEDFVLVVANSKYHPDQDWRTQLSELPLVQFSEAMPTGQMVATHLKRIRLDIPKRFSFETSRSVISTVARTGGWTMATPLSILDASRFSDDIELFELPFPRMLRSVFLINRKDELGSLPEALANTFRQLLRNELVVEFEKIYPSMSGMLEIHSDTLIE